MVRKLILEIADHLEATRWTDEELEVSKPNIILKLGVHQRLQNDSNWGNYLDHKHFRFCLIGKKFLGNPLKHSKTQKLFILLVMKEEKILGKVNQHQQILMSYQNKWLKILDWKGCLKNDCIRLQWRVSFWRGRLIK